MLQKVATIEEIHRRTNDMGGNIVSPLLTQIHPIQGPGMTITVDVDCGKDIGGAPEHHIRDRQTLHLAYPMMITEEIVVQYHQ